MANDLKIKIGSSGKFLIGVGNFTGHDYLLKSSANPKILKRQTKQIAEKVQQRIARNIVEEKSFMNKKLARLKPSTIKRKKSSTILIETGKLIRSIAIQPQGKGYEVYVRPLKYRNGANTTDVAKYTQDGDPLRNRPARKFFGISKKDFNEIVDKVLKVKQY